MKSHRIVEAARDYVREYRAFVIERTTDTTARLAAAQKALEACVDALPDDAGEAVVKFPTLVGYRLPLRYDHRGAIIFDADDRNVLDVRGWGHLTGHGADGLGLSDKNGTLAQDTFGAFVVARVNAPPPPVATGCPTCGFPVETRGCVSRDHATKHAARDPLRDLFDATPCVSCGDPFHAPKEPR